MNARRFASTEAGPAALEDIRAALARPESYPHGPSAVTERETHISWVFLAGDRAYKLKKPVVLDFADYGTVERRRRMCEEEVRLNRRLAPFIYLGVRGVARTGNGVVLTDPDDPRAIEFIVEMRRYDEEETLAGRLERGVLRPDEMVAVGRRLAAFHAQAARLAPASPVMDAERRFERNVHELVALVERPGDVSRLLALERLAHGYIAAHAGELRTRAARGLIRDCHGDLRAEHVLCGTDLQIVDCVEFDPGLRALDVADDLAFLVSDLVNRGARRLADVLVRAYREAGGDPGADGLVAFYASYRALVRAKVALVRARQHPAASRQRTQATAESERLLGAAERFAWRARLPLVIVVCGVPASGKSVLARALRRASGLPIVSSDLVRKKLGGVPSSQRAPKEMYATAWNARTYAELARDAARHVARTGGAIVDATFRHRADRARFSAGLSGSWPLLFLECRAPASVLRQRADRRQRDPRSVSDADLNVVLSERSSWDVLDEVAPASHLAIRTDRPTDELLAEVLAVLDLRLSALVGHRA